MTDTTKRENPFISLIFNLAVPNIILLKFANDDYLGNWNGFWLALAFPLSYGIYDFIVRRNFNVIAILGFVNVLLTGGIGLLGLGGIWFAVKEAAIPAVIGLAIILTQNSDKPLVRQILYNDQILNVDKIDAEISDDAKKESFKKLMSEATYIIFASFVFSAVINFALASYLIESPPGSQSFNEEVGTMNLVSMAVIALPCTVMLGVALWRFGTGLRNLTGLGWQEILKQQ